MRRRKEGAASGRAGGWSVLVTTSPVTTANMAPYTHLSLGQCTFHSKGDINDVKGKALLTIIILVELLQLMDRHIFWTMVHADTNNRARQVCLWNSMQKMKNDMNMKKARERR